MSDLMITKYDLRHLADPEKADIMQRFFRLPPVAARGFTKLAKWIAAVKILKETRERSAVLV